MEPELNQQDFKSRVHQYLLKKTDFLKVKDTLNDDQLRVFVDKAIMEMCRDQDIIVTTEQRITLIRELVSAVMSLGPLRPLVEDKTISEIMINGHNAIYIERHGHIELSNVKFTDNNHLLHTIQKILAASGSNKRVD